MQMTVREALDYVVKANGKPFTVELRDNILKFLTLLPHCPNETEWLERGAIKTVRDYDYGWFARVLIEENNGKLTVEVIDGDNLDPNPNRVKTNAEALALLKEYREIKFASDVDEYWNMSDDHKYWIRMSEMDMRAFAKQDEIKRRLY
ncbi:hypothetical protein [Bacillus phage vB_BanS-Thrax3]|nr:hypothetical protein [Bacillus phage vB_BanS-Thrax3]